MLSIFSKAGNGAVAQSVEQRTENPCVAGSIPAHTTSKSQNPRWSWVFLFCAQNSALKSNFSNFTVSLQINFIQFLFSWI
jgi:hypothetical protein